MCLSVERPRGGTASRSDSAAPSRVWPTASPQFRLAYREGTRISDDLFAVYVRANGLTMPRLGISVPARLGGAVRRNRLKRQIREAIRATVGELPGNSDIVIVARSGAAVATFDRMQESIYELFRRAAGLRR